MKLPGIFRKSSDEKSKDRFSIKQVFVAFMGVPRILRFVWSASALLTMALGLTTILQGFAPALSISITAFIIDSVVTGIRIHSTAPIWLPVGLQLGIVLLSDLLSTCSSIAQHLLQERVSNHVQFLIMEKSNSLDLAFFEDSEFYDRLRQATSQSGTQVLAMISQTFDLCRTTVTLFSMIFLLLHLAWWLAIVAIIAPIPAFISNTRYGWDGYQLMRRQSPLRRLMLYFGALMTTDTYNKEIKLFNLGNYFINQFRSLTNQFYGENKQIITRRFLANLAWTTLTSFADTAIYIYIALQAVAGRITIGGLSLYTQTVWQVGGSFHDILNGISNAYESNLYISTLFEFLKYKPKLVSPQNPRPFRIDPETKGLDIEFRNVSFTYPGKDAEAEATLKDVSFTIRAGEAIALVGRNGAGKTTLVKLLTRLYDPDEGEILINGSNIKEYDLKEMRDQIGVIFQDFVNYYLSAYQNIGVGRVDQIENRALIESAACKSGADAVIERLPQGYDTVLGRWFEKGAQLSGGEWQKIALARAFMRDARILILDEPTSSLDAHAEYEVFTNFRTLSRGKTSIFISHRFSTVRLADRIFVVENGSVTESGSHQELMELNGRYAELFNLQAEAYR